MTDTGSRPAHAAGGADSTDRPQPSTRDWGDPTIPAGNAPPLPRWPLVASAMVFGLWLIFLVAMAYLRVRTTPV